MRPAPFFPGKNAVAAIFRRPMCGELCLFGKVGESLSVELCVGSLVFGWEECILCVVTRGFAGKPQHLPGVTADFVNWSGVIFAEEEGGCQQSVRPPPLLPSECPLSLSS